MTPAGAETRASCAWGTGTYARREPERLRD